MSPLPGANGAAGLLDLKLFRVVTMCIPPGMERMLKAGHECVARDGMDPAIERRMRANRDEAGYPRPGSGDNPGEGLMP